MRSLHESLFSQYGVKNQLKILTYLTACKLRFFADFCLVLKENPIRAKASEFKLFLSCYLEAWIGNCCQRPYAAWTRHPSLQGCIYSVSRVSCYQSMPYNTGVFTLTPNGSDPKRFSLYPQINTDARRFLKP